MRRPPAVAWLALTALTSCASHAHTGEHLLPLTRLRLYESGVGYFERAGGLSSQPIALSVPESHVDDVLASLVLLSEHERPRALRFPSRLSAAVARARAGLPADTEEALGYDRVLASLRGEQVEVVVDARTVRGRVLEAIAVAASEATYLRPEAAAKTAREPVQIQLVLLTDEQRLERVDASSLTSVRPLDPNVAEGYAAALSARRSLRKGTRQALLELLAGLGTGPAGRVRFGYVSEVPLWRPTYRLLFSEQGARLQAWAVVHNDTEEAWRNVRVTLETGYPKSFLFPLTAPRYGRRELLHPNEDLPSVPQLLTTNADAMWGDFGDYAGEELAGTAIDEGDESGTVGLGLSGTGRGAGGHGGRDAKAPRLTAGSRLLEVGDLARPATPASAGSPPPPLRALPIDLDLPGHHSALVPFLMGAIDASPLVWFEHLGGTPTRAVRVVNGSDRMLPDGPLSVYRGTAFTGEGVLHRARPGEAQYVRIGGSHDASVQLLSETTHSTPQRLAFAQHDDRDGARIVVHSLQTSARELEITVGADGGSVGGQRSTIRVAVALPIVPNATLQGADAIDYDVVERRVVGVFELPASQRKRYQLRAKEGVERGFYLTTMSEDDARAWLAETTIPADERAIIEQALPTLARVRSLRAEHDEAEAAESQTQTALRSVRAQLDKTSGEAATPLVTRLLELEQELGTHETRRTELEATLEREQAALRSQLRKLPAQPR